MKRVHRVVASERKHRGSRAPLSNTCTAIPPKKGHTTVGGYLTGVYLIRIHFICVCLIGVRLMGVYLTGVHLIGVYLTGMHLRGVCHRRVPHGRTPHRHVLYGHVYVSKSKKALEKPSDPPPYKRWSSCRDLNVKDEFWR